MLEGLANTIITCTWTILKKRRVLAEVNAALADMHIRSGHDPTVDFTWVRTGLQSLTKVSAEATPGVLNSLILALGVCTRGDDGNLNLDLLLMLHRVIYLFGALYRNMKMRDHTEQELEDLTMLIVLFTGAMKEAFADEGELPAKGEPGRFFNFHVLVHVPAQVRRGVQVRDELSDVALCCVVLRCVVLDVALRCVVLRSIGACTSFDVALCCIVLRCIALDVALCCVVSFWMLHCVALQRCMYQLRCCVVLRCVALCRPRCCIVLHCVALFKFVGPFSCTSLFWFTLRFAGSGTSC
jgi:hypothetical protein